MKRKRRARPTKPTGNIFGKTIHLGYGPAEISKLKAFEFPKDKAAAEDFVMTEFAHQSRLCNSSKLIPIIYYFEPHFTEHGPDFVARLIDGSQCYIELFEIAPLLGPYDPNTYITIQQWLDFTKENINKKIKKYARHNAFRPIRLLIYATHSNFTPFKLEAFMLTDELRNLRNEVFKSIHVISFNHEGHSITFKVWPSNQRNFTINQRNNFKKWTMVRPNYEKVKIVADQSAGTKIDTTVRIFFGKVNNHAIVPTDYPDGCDPTEWFLPEKTRKPT